MSGVVDGGARPGVKPCPRTDPHNPHEHILGVELCDCPGIPLDRVVDGGNPTGAVVEMRGWLAARRRFDDLRRLRPWGIGSVAQHPVEIGEGRLDKGQLRIERSFPHV